MAGHSYLPDSPAFPVRHPATGTCGKLLANRSHVWQDDAFLQFCSGDWVRRRTRDCAGDHCTKSPMTRRTDRKPTAGHSTGGPTHLVQSRATDFTVPPRPERVPESAFHHIPAERDLALPSCAPSFGAARVARVSDTVTQSAPNDCQLCFPL